MKMKREMKIGLAAVAMILAVATTIAAVPGIFSSVDSTSGYTIGGSAGLSGQALCSDGVHFNTPCSTGTGTITGVSVTAPIVGGGSSGTVNVALDATKFIPRTCNSAGCYEVVNGTYRMWGHSITIADGAPGTNVCFPIAFPTGIDSANVTDDFNVGASSTPSVAGLTPSSGASPFPCTNGGLWVWGTRSGNAVYWLAIGH